MSMTRTHSFSSAKLTWRLAAGLLVACCVAVPALAQETAQPETAFGQPMPRQYFLNQLTNPAHDPAPGQASGGGAGQAGGGQAGAQAAEEEGSGPYPKHYLLNRLMGN
jgi:hypothetical protein